MVKAWLKKYWPEIVIGSLVAFILVGVPWAYYQDQMAVREYKEQFIQMHSPKENYSCPPPEYFNNLRNMTTIQLNRQVGKDICVLAKVDDIACGRDRNLVHVLFDIVPVEVKYFEVNAINDTYNLKIRAKIVNGTGLTNLSRNSTILIKGEIGSIWRNCKWIYIECLKSQLIPLQT